MSDCIQCLFFDDFGHLWIGTDLGLCVYNGSNYWMTPETTAALPKANLSACACALDGTHYFATPFGILIHQDGMVKYLGYKRWIPHPDVRCVALCADGTPTSYIPAQKALFDGSAFTENMVKMLLGNVRDYAQQRQVPVLDYLLPHDWNSPQTQSYEAFRDYMLTRFETFPDGISETFIHPSLECDELKGITRSWQRRVWEHRLFADPATRQYIESCGIQLISYRELAEMRLGAR